MPRKLLPLLAILWPVLTYSQDWNYYQPIKSHGEIPSDFTDAYSTKFETETSGISKDEKRKTRKRKEAFHKRSEYFIDEYLTSGKVFFGDTITNYCRAVLDKVIGDNEQLKQSISLYTIKSPEVNATATANGIIFVNLGLVAQLESEAQLAYILSHELIHYTNDHVIDQFIEQEKIANGEDLYRRTSDDEKITQLSAYSKNQELEADTEGFEKYYQKSGYNTHTPFEVLDILQYAYLPFNEIPFDKSFFENGSYNFPKTYFLNEVASIKAEDDYDDENSTHPNLLKRRKKIKKLITAKEGENFLVSEDGFRHCRKMARFELSRLNLLNRNYPRSIYNSYLLLKRDSTNRYLRLSVAKALSALTVYQNEGDLYDVLENYEDIEGESQQLYYLFDQMGGDEFSVLNLNYTYLLKKDYPEDEAIDRLYKKAVKMVAENDLTPDDFFTEHKASMTEKIQDELDSLADNYDADSKIAKIKSRKKEDEVDGDENYWKYALVDYLNDEKYGDDLEEAVEEYEESNDSKSTFRKRRDKYSKNRALDISKATCVTPKYLKLDQRDDDGIKYLSTAERLKRYNSYIKSISRKVGLQLNILDYKNKSNDIESFNDMVLLQNWLSERMKHVNREVIPSDFDYVDDLIENLDSRYVISTGHLTLRESENYAYAICASIIMPYYLPFAIADLVTPDYESFSYFFVFDLKSGDALMAEYNYYKTSDAPDYLKSTIYNYLLQVTDKPKK